MAASPMSTDLEDEDDDLPFPLGVRIAGAFWMLTGVVGMLGSVVLVIVGVVVAGGNPVGVCGAVCCFAFAWIFLSVGSQTFHGDAPDTLGNGSGSVGIALFCLGACALIGVGLRPDDWWTVAVMGQFGGFGLLLMLAGVLALFGRGEYRAWRESHGPPPDPDDFDRLGKLADRRRASRGEQ